MATIQPGVLTFEGIQDFGWNDEELHVIELPDGRFDDQINRTYDNRDEIKKALQAAKGEAREAAE